MKKQELEQKNFQVLWLGSEERHKATASEMSRDIQGDQGTMI
jgi:hypothetical protein